MNNNKRLWERLGKNDPYFSVATFDKFRSENLNESLKSEFFLTGEDYIARIWDEIEGWLRRPLRPKIALDFGCGVGRLLPPLASRAERVTGVDVSQGMLEEAKKNFQERSTANVNFLLTDEFLKDNETYEFIHSTIVFQHIRPSVGIKILSNILKKLEVGGVGCIQLTYHVPLKGLAALKFRLNRDVPYAFKFRKFLTGKSKEEFIPIYEYDLNRIVELLRINDCHNCLLRFSHHGAEGVVFIFEKKALPMC